MVRKGLNNAILSSLLLTSSFAMATSTDDVVSAVESKNNAGQASQQKIDQYSEQTDSMLAEYKAVLRQLDSMRVYNNQLERMVSSQNSELASLEKQINQIDQTAMEIVPLTLKMIDSLDQFVQLDLPFQLEEREKRIASLHEMMDRADVTTSEKFRRVLEAYQIEEGFSRNIEAYKASMARNGDTKTYDFLRIGRTALFFQSPDGAETGMWNKQTNQWEALPEGYSDAITQGLRIAKKQAPPALIELPVFTGEK